MDVKKVLIFGNSHSRSFKDVSIDGYEIIIRTISGASVIGLHKFKSFLGVSDIIFEELKKHPNTDFIVLKLGQVDVENIYLYKKYIDKSFKCLNSFFERILQSYEKFLVRLSEFIDLDKIIVWGINPPTPVNKYSRGMIQAYFNSMVIHFDRKDRKKYKSVMKNKDFLIDLEYSNRMKRSKLFNSLLEDLTKKVGTRYGEVFQQLLSEKEEIKSCFEGCNFHIIGTNCTEINDPADPKIKNFFQDALNGVIFKKYHS